MVRFLRTFVPVAASASEKKKSDVGLVLLCKGTEVGFYRLWHVWDSTPRNCEGGTQSQFPCQRPKRGNCAVLPVIVFLLNEIRILERDESNTRTYNSVLPRSGRRGKTSTLMHQQWAGVHALADFDDDDHEKLPI
jgi:hypothetical protein